MVRYLRHNRVRRKHATNCARSRLPLHAVSVVAKNLLCGGGGKFEWFQTRFLATSEESLNFVKA